MALAWRGYITSIHQLLRGYRMGYVRIGVRYEAYDDADPQTTLREREETWKYEGQDLVGLTLAELGALLLNEGIVGDWDSDPPPGWPPEQWPPPPDPPALRDRGTSLLATYRQTRVINAVMLPYTFGA